MRNGDIYKFDLQNRYPASENYIVSETTDGSLTVFVVINGNINGRSKNANRDQAIFNVRVQLVGDVDILPELTTTQRNSLTKSRITRRQMIYNTTTDEIEVFDGTTWT